MERFEMTNLVFDVNWPAWAATATLASPAFPDGFKMSALWVQAKEGLLKGVKVKNCGASGRVPAPNWNGAGAEAFPLYVQPHDYLRNYPNPAWVIEDCEVSDFHAVHGGYATMIMVQCTDPLRFQFASTNSTHRVACVRHCFISGNGAGIGFGSAGSVGVTFYENLLSDLHDGFNFDTASEAEPLRYFDITNNVFLDVHTLGNIGAAGTCGFFSDFTVSQNAVRLRGVPLEQDYTDFRWTNQVFGSWSNRMPVTDVSLAVGRFATGACHGLRLAGASNIVFADNRFTTWPQTNFFLPDTGNTGAASFCPLWLPTQVEESQAWICPSTALTFSGTRVSGTAFDFRSLTIPDPNFVTNGVDAIGANPPGFEPWGRVGRLTLCLNCPTAVREVSVGKPGLVAGKVQVRARIVRHKLGGAYDTESELPNNLRLLVIAGGTSNVVQPTVQGYLADFEFTPTANTHYELIVYQDEEPPGFDADRESWARTEYDHGTVVRFERTPDVANDRRLIAGQLNLVRTGTNTPLVVKLRSAPTNQVGRPALAGPMCEYLTAKYGWQCDREYYTWTCTETTDWDFPLDVDGDGLSDFVLSHRWASSRCQALPPLAQFWGTDAVTWTLFPEAHVQVLGWVQWYQPGVKAPEVSSPALPPGYPIVPDPATLRAPWKPSAWAEPHLQAHVQGYGIGSTVEYYVCPGLPCPLPQSVGLVSLATTPALFGVQMARTDGWHLGWLRVGYYRPEVVLPDGHTTRVILDDYAIHPDPDTEIEAGQPPRPRLWYATEGDRVRLWWSAAWAGYRLESASAPTGSAWEPVDGVADRSVTLPKGVGARFFRLVQPSGP